MVHPSAHWDLRERMTVRNQPSPELVADSANGAVFSEPELQRALLQTLEMLGQGVALVDGRSQRVLWVNEALLRHFGYGASELLSLNSYFEIVAPDQVPPLRERLRRRLSGLPEPEHYTTAILHKDGTRRDVEVAIKLVGDGPARFLFVLRDVTEARRAAEQMRDSESKLLSLTQSIPDFVTTIDREGHITFINRVVAGVELKSVLGSDVCAWVPPEDRDRLRKIFEKAFQTGLPDTYEVHSLGSNGQEALYRTTVGPIRNGGEVKELVLVSTDITGIRRATQALRESEEHFRTLYENLTIGVYRTTPEGRVLLANPTLLRMLGYASMDQLSERNLESDYEPSYSRQAFREWIERHGEIRGLEAAWHRRDGSTIFVRESARLVRHPDGGPKYYEGTVEDITDRKRVEEDLTRTLSLHKATLESTTDGILVVDRGGKITSYNRRFVEMWRIPEEVLVSRDDDRALAYVLDQLQDPEGFLRKVRELYAQTELESYDVLEFKDGRVFERYSLPQQIAGQSVGRVWSFRDVTKRKRAEEERARLHGELEERVKQRTAQLEVANKELEAFSYSVSHDLRAPLRSIDGFCHEILEDHGDRFDPAARQLFERVRMASHRMAQLIDDLLTLSRVTRSQMHRRTVNLSAMAQSVAGALRMQEPDRKVEVVIAPNVLADGDERFLQVVLQNMLDNAWKFTSKHPTARVEFGTAEREGRPVYFVRDDGAGFDMAHVHKLFGAFQRLHTSADFEGTGIGLATVQRIVHRHGGKVWAEAGVEQGATFFFTL